MIPDPGDRFDRESPLTDVRRVDFIPPLAAVRAPTEPAGGVTGPLDTRMLPGAPVEQVNLRDSSNQSAIAVHGHSARFTGNVRRKVDYTQPRFRPAGA
ncbi:hypothetical protein KM043_008331 [Ampulex compressa]|nr:hypothetical protein KM043_008331 [Ampulex compressa]